MTDKDNTIEESAESNSVVTESADANTGEGMTSNGQVDVQGDPEGESVVSDASINDTDLANYVEAMVFSSASPLQSAKISQALGMSGVGRIKKAIAALNESYEASDRSFRIRQVAGGYQFYVLPQWSDCLKKLFTKTRKIRLTKAALETMAIVAYKQPVSKNQIEFIRGVASDGVLHNLLEKNLIRISGRAEGAGRSLLYSATDEFLKFFGLNTFDDLPRIAEIEELIQNMESERAEAIHSESESNDSDEATISAVEDSATDGDASATDGEELAVNEVIEDSAEEDVAVETEEVVTTEQA